MPVTLRYSAALDQTYEESNPLSVSTSSNLAVAVTPTATGNAGTNGSGGCIESPASPSSHCSPSSLHSRTSSTDSLDDSVGSGGHSRQLSSDSTEFIPTRTVKTNAKPAFNPLQFVKTGAAPLYKKAEQQIKQYEDVRKVKEMVKEEEEAWQSNLDNWKSKRRQISHHTIQRAEEIKQIEEVEHNRQRKKSKTFSEMMEERSKRRPSSSKLPVYDSNADGAAGESWDFKGEERHEDCNGLLDDTNASFKLNASFESSGSDQVFHDDDDDEEPRSQSVRGKSPSKDVEKSNGAASDVKLRGRNGVNNNSKEKKATNGFNGHTTTPEEYTFEKAIKSYAEYAESRTKTSRFSQSSEHGEQQPEVTSLLKAQSDNAVDLNREDVNGPGEERNEVMREEGEQLSVVVCVKRGGDCKDFGFTSKSIKGIGNGVFVEFVHPGSPADNVGLKVDDEIMSINGECTSNRSHSAIVFAVKQAVYTGWLELQIYRYANTDFLHVQRLSSVGDDLDRAKISGNGTSADRAVSRRREKSPKVDVMKRRSLFESSTRTCDKQFNRRSLDLNNSRFKDKLASFEKLETAESRTDRSKQTPKRDLSFKTKLASFKSMDSLDGRGDQQDRLVLSVDKNFTLKLSSFENVNGPDPTEDSPVQERGASFERWQPFERTKSCDHLNHCGSEEVTAVPGHSENGVLRDFSGPVDLITDDAPLLETSASDAAPKDANFEPIVNSALTASPETFVTSEMPDAVLDSVIDDDDVALGTAEKPVEVCRGQEVGLEREVPVGVFGFKSGFELAESLEETPITGSQPSSPLATEPVLEQNCDGPHNSGHSQIDQVAMADDWLTSQSEQTCFVASESLQPDNVDAVLGSEIYVVDGDEYADSPIPKLEPPKEKPPPPPVDVENNTNSKSAKVKRISSTKRIRKEIWRRRSDFLGIDGDGVEDYVENEIKNVSPPPKMEEFLLEEKQLTEQCLQDQLTRQWHQESDDMFRAPDSEVSSKLVALSQAAGNEDEIARKEREIIEDLEREEQLVLSESGSSRVSAHEDEEARLEDERVEAEETLRLEEDRKLKEREELLSCQEERLRLEKEKLRQEQEDLLREKEAYQKQIQEHQRYNPLAVQQPSLSLLHSPPTKGPVSPESRELRSRLPPPPPPVKPKLSSPRSLELIVDGDQPLPPQPLPSVAGLQQPIHLQIDDETKLLSSIMPSSVVPPPSFSASKQIIHALSASPRAKLMDSEQWLAKRKSDNSRNYNQQHWLVQEAEMRRILEQRELQHQQQRVSANNQRTVLPPSPDWSTSVSPKAPQPQSANGSPNYVQQLPAGHSHPHNQQHQFQALRMRPSVAPPLNPSVRHPHHHHHTQPIYGQTEGRLLPPPPPPPPNYKTSSAEPEGGSCSAASSDRDQQMLSVSGKKKCSHCTQELGRGAAMIIESLQLFYHIQCFQCCVCHVQLGNGTSGADVRVRNQKLHCHNCYSNDEGLKFSKV